MCENLCISIAVSRPKDLPPIPGAISSAKRIVCWAQAHRYDTELITDEQESVTSVRLKEIFSRKLGDGGQKRILISFAGHGLIRGGAEEYWLLNDWRTEAAEAVNHLKLMDRLRTYRPKQLAIISDACRSLPNAQAKYVEGNGIVTIKDFQEAPVQVAHLAGTTAAQPAFATPLGEGEQYCFFSHVLVNTLCGQFPEAIVLQEDYGEVITNDSLLSTVEHQLQRLASRYRCTQIPDLRSGWRLPGNIWSMLTQVKPTTCPPFDLPEAPPVTRFLNHGERGGRYLTAGYNQSPVHLFQDELKHEIRATHFETEVGLVVVGDTPLDVVVAPNFMAFPDLPHQDWYRLERKDGQASPVLAQLSDGSWVGAAVPHGFIGTFSIQTGEEGKLLQSFILRPVGEVYSMAELPIAKAVNGQPLADLFDLAATLREGKHQDPVLGVLAAYSYARAGAIDDIRRLAYYFVGKNQPIPFDIVLLANSNC